MAKKLLFLINTLVVGGAERALTNTVNRLSGEFDVTVQTLIGGGKLENRLNDSVKLKSIIKCRNKHLVKLFSYLIGFILPPEWVYRRFIKGEYDYEVTFLEGVPTKLISASDSAVRKIAWVHADLCNYFDIERVCRSRDEHIAVYERFDKIVCVSDGVKNAFGKRFGDFANVQVIHSVPDAREIADMAREPLPKNGKFRLVCVARLEYIKGVDRLLEVAKRLADDGVDCECVIVGDGSQRGELERYTIDNGLRDRITFIGESDNPYRYMASADIVVIPSRSEGYSTVACESVMLGKAVVTADCSGMSEIFEGGECGLIAENSTDGLYTAVKSMIIDGEMRAEYARCASERSKSLFLSNTRELEKLFED